MEAIKNPYTPGAGIKPHELMGRQEIQQNINDALQRVKASLAQQGIILYGLRGVGKTVLLRHCAENHSITDIQNINIEVSEKEGLIVALVIELRKSMLQMKQSKITDSNVAKRAVASFTNFVRAHGLQINVNFYGMKIEIHGDEKSGLADSGTLENDLIVLLENIGKMAQEQQTVIALFVDELQLCETKQLSALCAALHQTTQLRLPILLIAAGLPQLRGFLGKAKSYAERMFRYVEVGPLTDNAAVAAIINPVAEQGVEIEQDVVEKIISTTHKYPYFIQEWERNLWNLASDTPITMEDLRSAEKEAISELDKGFFSVRYERLTPSKKTYLRAMA